MKSGIHPNPLKSPFNPLNGIYKRFPLFKSMIRPPKKVNLLGGDAPLTSEKSEKDDLVPYWYPDITVNLVNFDSNLEISSIPSFTRRFIYADRIRKQYYPIIYFNELWELKRKRIPILDEEFHEMPLKISFSTTSLLFFRLMTYFDFAIKQQESVYGEHNEFESIKKMFIETSPWLIVLTFFISCLHVLFDFLAFKNDVQFWRKKKDISGLSVRGILINSLFQFVVFFYLLDSETSWIVLASVGIGALIEFWKITRVLEVKWSKMKFVPFLYAPSFHDRVSYAKSLTREYDITAVKYLAASAIPLLIGYSFWSLKYRVHKSWYSWILRSLVGFVYTFGFISMTPQLFINYKLKSVAHMPWKAFTYKALNTFIDDFFAFVIKMPWLHRIACFRDGKGSF
ncbi:hypothetical protein C9890_0083 [Perkinsus sp. BL_2016]|nr:hypothetical protein C9890_0083 [Perkinsus sp. BL_2016]